MLSFEEACKTANQFELTSEIKSLKRNKDADSFLYHITRNLNWLILLKTSKGIHFLYESKDKLLEVKDQERVYDELVKGKVKFLGCLAGTKEFSFKLKELFWNLEGIRKLYFDNFKKCPDWFQDKYFKKPSA
jgi:hypothetical protein